MIDFYFIFNVQLLRVCNLKNCKLGWVNLFMSLSRQGSKNNTGTRVPALVEQIVFLVYGSQVYHPSLAIVVHDVLFTLPTKPFRNTILPGTCLVSTNEPGSWSRSTRTVSYPRYRSFAASCVHHGPEVKENPDEYGALPLGSGFRYPQQSCEETSPSYYYW